MICLQNSKVVCDGADPYSVCSKMMCDDSTGFDETIVFHTSFQTDIMIDIVYDLGEG